jgi:hypothetical protein
MQQPQGKKKKKKKGGRLPDVGVVAMVKRSNRWLKRHWWKKWWPMLVVEGRSRSLQRRGKLAVAAPDVRWLGGGHAGDSQLF